MRLTVKLYIISGLEAVDMKDNLFAQRKLNSTVLTDRLV